MSIPTKGARKITVDGQVFLWLIRKNKYSCDCCAYKHLHVAIQDITKKGSTLVIETDCFYHQEYCEENNTSVIPSDVELWIKQARELGWQPKKPGKTFQTLVEDSILMSCSL